MAKDEQSNMMCKVSIIIPAYNAAAFINTALLSILSQTHQNFECIVIDDGSTDNTCDLIEKFKDPRLTLIKQKNSGGPASPRNVGLKNATGKYIFLFDADDVMHPLKLEKSIAALEMYENADFLFTNFSSINEHGLLLKENYLQEYEILWNIVTTSVNDHCFIASQQLYNALIFVNFIGTSSVVLRKSALSTLDLFDESLRNSDDRLFWSCFAKHHNAVFLNTYLHSYRLQPNSITSQDFLRRGPSKIRALQIMKQGCGDRTLRRVIDKQISLNHLGMAYSYKDKRSRLKQIEHSFKSLTLSFNILAARVLVHGLFLPYRR